MSLSDVDLEALNNWFAQMPSGPFNALHTTAGWEVRQIDTDPTNKHHWPYRLCSSIAGQVSACDDAVFSFIAGVINAWPAIYHAARAEGRPSPETAYYDGAMAALGCDWWEDGPDFFALVAQDYAAGRPLPPTMPKRRSPSPEAGREEDLRAEVLAIFKANKMATDERLAILIAERLAPRLSPPAPEPGYEAEPVAWRARDEGGKWLSSCTYENAVELARCFGTTVQPLYASPVPVEDIAEEIWRRFAPSYEETFAECANRSEYLLAADAILQRLSNQQGGGS